MIPNLPKNQLLGQHRECCALRGNGWNKKHKTVDYVFLYSYQVATEWRDKNYRGKIAESYVNLEEVEINTPIYKEHNDAYLQECIDNLRAKGIEIEVENMR